MRLRHAAVLLGASLLAACSGGTQEGVVRFAGFAPINATQKDTRYVQTFCPGCGDLTQVDTKRCTNKKCKIDIKWPDKYTCGSCQGTGVCPSCLAMEQTKGECYNCRGTGVLVYQGQSPNCPNCKGTQKCPLCGGSTKCKECGGEGKISKDVVKAKASKFFGGDLPESDPRTPVEPKKDDMPKKDTEEKKQ